MPLPLYQVDAFTDEPFRGNPAAVVLLDAPADQRWMQRVADEMNLSETAFLEPREDGAFGLRWFTPAAEVELCGHATLASAHVLWETGRLGADTPARFQTVHSGTLTAARVGDWIELDFPADPPETLRPQAPPPPPPAEFPGFAGPPGGPGAATVPEIALLADALRTRPAAVARARHDLLCELDSEQAVRDTDPDWDRLARIEARGVAVTAPSDDQRYDFVSRFFAPRLRIREDPVTGSIHCALGPYWARRLGRRELTGFQASPRGGVVRVRLAGDRAILAGQAVTVAKGELLA